MNLLADEIKKLYLKFLLPSLGSAMVMSIYTMTDAVVIGKGVGADALAALSFTTPLLCILMSTGILFGAGGSVQMNVFRGIGNEPKARRFFTLSFFSLAIVSLILWIFYLLKTPDLIRLMGANETLFPYVLDYMKYFNRFLPFAVFSNYLAIFVRADNDPVRAMAGVMLGGIVNIGLDILFVFPLQMGIGGAALASVLGMVLQTAVAASHFLSKKNQLKLIRPRKIGTSIGIILGCGMSGFFNEFANGFIVLLFNIQILKYSGNKALSVYSVISNCMILFNSLFTGVGQAIAPIVSTNFGARKQERVSAVRRMSYITVIGMGLVFSLTGILFPGCVCSIFMKMDAEMRQIADYGVRLYFIAFLPLGINLLTSYYLQAVLQAEKSLCISLLRNVVLSGIGIIMMPKVFGGNVLWLIIPLVEFTVLLISAAMIAHRPS